ncbi:hypothetical protein L1987_46688 [Smallanthus sonchifolius]|uniref:Uncharacterized protein n=1 Tax=Smallanthus sonchifolius TaxID=185202 RepID=A0ACB9G1H8_9ASTR|nr:hypothetical protein L1987_46688 [Smallanthus sonchifolius]
MDEGVEGYDEERSLLMSQKGLQKRFGQSPVFIAATFMEIFAPINLSGRLNHVLSWALRSGMDIMVTVLLPEMVKEVVDLLTNASDGAKSLIEPNDRLILYVEIARLFGNLGYHRKAVFFSRQVAKLYLQHQNNLAASSALQALAITTKAYRVQSRATIPLHNVSNVSYNL